MSDHTATKAPPTPYRPDVRHTRLGDGFFDTVSAARFPRTIVRFRNDRAAAEVGLDGLDAAAWVTHFGRFEPLAGNLPEPLALRYHGHQFRTYNPDLGDGRGFLFAQMRDTGDRLMDLGTKGSGTTPWSRAGDGRLTLKGGVREVLATEMLEALGVRTSRSFSLIETGEELFRGDEPSPARSSVLVRLSHSHLRIGTFQRLLYLEDHAALEVLVDYAIAEYWPDAAETASPATRFFDCVVGAVAQMGAQWFAAGFVHGVLNTDNITITGESFDYGPWRFLPVLDPAFTAAYFDHQGLYAFGRQPDALFWNLARLGECLVPLSTMVDLKAVLDTFPLRFEAALARSTLARLGLAPGDPATDYKLSHIFYGALRAGGTPFEQAFFDLAGGAEPARIALSPVAAIYGSESWRDVISAIRARAACPGAADALALPPYAGGRPETLLIDEVEQIWGFIAGDDDWSAFHAKIKAIGAFGAANRLLASL